MSVIFTSQTYSKYKSGGNDGNPYLYWLTVDLQSQNTTANTSDILVTLYISAKVGSGTLMWSTAKSTAPTSTITIEGTTYPSTENVGSSSSNFFIDDGKFRRYARNATGQVIAQKALTINHDSNGQKFISVAFDWIAGTSVTQYYPASFTSNGAAVELPAIARGGTIIAPSSILIDNVIGEMQYQFQSYGSYYYDLSYEIDGHTVTVWNKQHHSAGVGATYTINESWILANCSLAQANLTFTLVTYADSAGSTVITTTTTKTVVNIDTSYYKPSLTFTALTPSSLPIANKLVAGYSSLSADYTATMATGANLVSVAFSSSYGTMATPTLSTLSGTASTNVLSGSTASGLTIAITALVTDSRGATFTVTSTAVTVYPYAPPEFTDIKCYRVASVNDDTEDGAGLYVYIEYTATTNYTVDGTNSIQSVVCRKAGIVRPSPSWVAQNADASALYIFTATDNVTSSETRIRVGYASYSLDLYDGGTAQDLGAALAGPIAEPNKVKLGDSHVTEVNLMSTLRFLTGNELVLGNLADGSNANDLFPNNDTGITMYYTTNANNRTNWPSARARCLLIAYRITSAYGVQICWGNTDLTVYLRIYSASSWQGWKSITFS